MSERVIVDFMNNVVHQLYDIRLAIVLIFVWLLGITYKLFHKSDESEKQ